MKLRFPTTIAPLAIAAFALISAPSLLAQTTWTGNSSTAWSTSGNWNNGLPSTSVAAIFDVPTANLPYLTAAGNAASITFNQAGWTIGSNGVGYVNMRSTAGPTPIISNGSGTNTIQNISSYSAADTAVTTGLGNTLVIEKYTNVSSPTFRMSSKGGAGTLVLGSAAAFNMSLLSAVNAGTLIVNSANTTTIAANTIVANGATLGGIGSLGYRVSGTHTFSSGSTLAPGTQAIGGTSAGVFSFLATASVSTGSATEKIDMLSGSILAIDLYGDGTSDSLYFGGSGATAKLTKVVLDLDTNVTLALNAGTAAYNTAYTIATFEEAGEFFSANGMFSSVTLNGNALVQGIDYTIAYTDHAAYAPGVGSIAVTLIPEPQTAALVAVSLAFVIIRYRYRRG